MERVILDASFFDNSVALFTKLKWIPIDDIIRFKKLCMFFKIVNQKCPEYFSTYIKYVKNRHNYNTRVASKLSIDVPKSFHNSGLRTFHSSTVKLWNNLQDSTKSSNFKQFKSIAYSGFLNRYVNIEHFEPKRTF